MYGLYEFDHTCKLPELNMPDGYTQGKFKPNIFSFCAPNEKLTLIQKLSRLYFFVICRGNFEIYYIKDVGDNIVHTSYVVGKCFKFRFMNKSDYEIGPCHTADKHRGKGLYPYVLKTIIGDKNNDAGKFYMIIRDDNIASIRGVQKCCFVKTSELIKTRFLKIYSYNQKK